MKKDNVNKENKITEILASSGCIFPRNKTELEQFELLFGNVNFGLTGREIDPEIILSKNVEEPNVIDLAEYKHDVHEKLKLVAKTEEESTHVKIKKIHKKQKGKDLEND
jgi:hypothetical protein